MRAVEASVRDGARRAVVRLTLGAAAGLVGLVGLGFLTASGARALAAQIGWTWAALAIGAGFVLLSGGLMWLASRNGTERAVAVSRVPVKRSAHPPREGRASGASAASLAQTGQMLAFTAAFVLGRRVAHKKRR